MATVMMDQTRINWASIDRARMYFRENYGPEFSIEDYQDWMLLNWGIVHRFNNVSIDDETKYTMFLLRFAQ